MEDKDWMDYVIKVALSLGLVWFIASMSVFKLKGEHRWFIFSMLGLSLFGAVYSSLSATDVSRMFFLLTPVMAILVALWLAGLNKQDQWLITLFVLLNILMALALLPSIIFSGIEVGSLEQHVINKRYWLFAIGSVQTALIAYLLIRNSRMYPQNQNMALS
jgi:hypothetical protein